MSPNDPPSDSVIDPAFEAELTRRLQPLLEVEPPDLWPADLAAPPTETPRVWPRLLMAAAAVAVLGGVTALLMLARDSSGSVDAPPTEAGPDERADDGSATETDPGPDPSIDETDDQGSTGGTEANETDVAPDPRVGPDPQIGPDLSSLSFVPTEVFLVVESSGRTLVLSAEGVPLGHYPQPPPWIDQLVGPSISLAPEDCRPIQPTVSGEQLWSCRDEVGPTLAILNDGEPVVLARFPERPADLPPDAQVVGEITRAIPAPFDPWRGRPVLLQMRIECEAPIAMIVEQPTSTTDEATSGVIRHINNTSYWDEEWPAGESVALGWGRTTGADQPAEDEAYIWRFDGPCSTELAQPGVYAYRLDGTSRLLFPVAPDAEQVHYVDPRTPAVDTVAAEIRATEAWNAWAGSPGPAVAFDDFPDETETIGRFLIEEVGLDSPPELWLGAEAGIFVVESAGRYLLVELSDDARRVVAASTFRPVSSTDQPTAMVMDLATSVAREEASLTRLVIPTNGYDLELTVGLDGAAEPLVTELEDGAIEVVVEREPGTAIDGWLDAHWRQGDWIVGFSRLPLALAPSADS